MTGEGGWEVNVDCLVLGLKIQRLYSEYALRMLCTCWRFWLSIKKIDPSFYSE